MEDRAFAKDSLPEPGEHLELVCLRGGFDVVRGRVPPRGPVVVVRTGISTIRPVPAEIFRIEVERSWVFGHTRFVKGLINDSRLDLAPLELEPLELQDCGLWDPEEHAWLFKEDSSPLYDEIRVAGSRPMYEMEQILPEDVVELRWEEDPVLEAVELADAGALGDAQDLLGDLLTADLRCLDAHAHLGNFELRSVWRNTVDRATRHYRVGVAIGELSLPRSPKGFLLPWGLLDNRPYLRCLHGLGLCLWRQGDIEAADQIFHRLVWLNPDDNVGARFLLQHTRAGMSWEEFEQLEKEAQEMSFGGT